jgi:hypothetical protein
MKLGASGFLGRSIFLKLVENPILSTAIHQFSFSECSKIVGSLFLKLVSVLLGYVSSDPFEIRKIDMFSRLLK